MKVINYLKDKMFFIILFLITYVILLMMFIAFKIPLSLIIVSTIVLILSIVIFLTIEYFRKASFYNQLLLNVERLDKKYLVLETISKPSFYEGELLYQTLYEINKSMVENVKEYELSINDFKEYIEMWIHEAKIPILSLVLV